MKPFAGNNTESTTTIPKPTHWFTADTHFGHAGILKHQTTRPGGGDLKEHDEILIANWNAVVKKGDIVHHAGDFAWHDPEKYLRRLNGSVHLTLGNHDRMNAAQAKGFASIKDLSKVKVDGQLIYVMHYAMRVWNQSHYGTWHLYGHSHGSLPDNPNSLSFDVGVDVHSYRPISYDEVVAIMATKTWKPVDHHNPSGTIQPHAVTQKAI